MPAPLPLPRLLPAKRLWGAGRMLGARERARLAKRRCGAPTRPMLERREAPGRRRSGLVLRAVSRACALMLY
eukprot:3807648-Alexandrium_andersonii.AAC.1